MVHVELQITAADPTVFAIAPLGTRLPLKAGDLLSLELARPGPATGNGASSDAEKPVLVRLPKALTLYLGSDWKALIVLNGQVEVYCCDRPRPPLPDPAAGELVAFRKGPLPTTARPADAPGNTLLDDNFLSARHWFRNIDGQSAPLPSFQCEVHNLDRVRQQLDGMYIGLDVRFALDGQLAFYLEVPDRLMTPWLMPIARDKIGVLEQLAKESYSYVIPIYEGAERLVLIEPFEHLSYDFSGVYAHGHRDYLDGHCVTACQVLEPLVATNPRRLPAAHQLLGHCYRDRGDPDRAIKLYRSAALAATDPSGRLLPGAAGALADLAEVYRSQGQLAKAAHCLLHSLCLRPNHPAALRAYSALFADWPELWEVALLRIAAIGGHKDVLTALAELYTAVKGGERDALLTTVHSRCATVDLKQRLFVEARSFNGAAFLGELDRAEGQPARPRLFKAKPPRRPYRRHTAAPPPAAPPPAAPPLAVGNRGFVELGLMIMNLEIALGAGLVVYGLNGNLALLVLGLFAMVVIGYCRWVARHRPTAFITVGVAHGALITVAVVSASLRIAVVAATAMMISFLAFLQADDRLTTSQKGSLRVPKVDD